MICAWKELLNILPLRMRQVIDRDGREEAQQIYLRCGGPPELVFQNNGVFLDFLVTADDLNFVVNSASRYSPWAAATISKGYLTAPGGHRIGICGEAVMKEDHLTGIRNITSLCIRIARDFPGISRDLAAIKGSILILGAPGWGKTTLLRDLIRSKSQAGNYISVIDERQELFPEGYDRGPRTEVLSLCRKDQGIDMVLRTMCPKILATDEITAAADCAALQHAAWCGVSLLATAHASGLADYLHREVYTPLVKQNLFDTIVVLHQDKSWHLERSGGWHTNGSVRY